MTSILLSLVFVLVGICVLCHADFSCRYRVEQYYSAVNTGNFTGALSTLSDDVVYDIKGTPGLLPFIGTWINKTGVTNLFKAFGATFQVVEISQKYAVWSNNPSEWMQFNYEAFRMKNSGFFLDFTAIHYFTFDSNCLIRQFFNYYDTYSFSQAYNFTSAIDQPIISSLPVPGQDNVSGDDALDLVQKFYSSGLDVADYLASNVQLIVPGDKSVIPFSGIFIGPAEVQSYLQSVNTSLQLLSANVTHTIVTNGGVAVLWDVEAQVITSGKSYYIQKVDYFQVSDSLQIARFTQIWDSYPVFRAFEQSSL